MLGEGDEYSSAPDGFMEWARAVLFDTSAWFETALVIPQSRRVCGSICQPDDVQTEEEEKDQRKLSSANGGLGDRCSDPIGLCFY
jgi:hypothetical protein